MERIVENQVFKTVIIDNEPIEVLDYTIKQYWNDTEVEDPETHEMIIQSALTKTEKIMNDVDGTIFDIVEQSGCVSQRQIYPIVEPAILEPTGLETCLAQLAREILILKGAI